MTVPLQVTFRHMQPSAAMQARIRALAARLEGFSHRILHCHVTIQAPPRHHQQGRLFDIRIDLAVPGDDISIRRARPVAPAHQDPYVALRDAFQAARRKLQDYERKHRYSVHSP